MLPCWMHEPFLHRIEVLDVLFVRIDMQEWLWIGLPSLDEPLFSDHVGDSLGTKPQRVFEGFMTWNFHRYGKTEFLSPVIREHVCEPRQFRDRRTQPSLCGRCQQGQHIEYGRLSRAEIGRA